MQRFDFMRAIYTGLTLTLLLTSCIPEDLAEDLQLAVTSDIFHIPMSIQFVDAAGGEPVGLTVRVSGPDADMIYGNDGKRAIDPVRGILEIAVDKRMEISPAIPLELTFTAIAPGYEPTERTIRIYDRGYHYYRVPMLNTNRLPVGVSAVSATIPMDGVLTAEEFMIETGLENGKSERASLRIPEGVSVNDATGETLEGNLQLEFRHADNRNSTTLRTLPGGLLQEEIIDANGQVIGPIQFLVAGLVSIDLSVKGRAVKTFSDPVIVSMELNANTANIAKKRRVAPGDRLPVWTIDEVGDTWRYHGEAQVATTNDGKLIAAFVTDHLSQFLIGDILDNLIPGDNPFVLTINTNGPVAFPAGFPLQIIEPMSGQPLEVESFFSSDDLMQLELSSVPADLEVELQLVDLFDPGCANILNTFDIPLLLPGGSSTWNFTPPASSNTTIQMRLVAACPNVDPAAPFLPFGKVYYRQSNSNCPDYEFLATVEVGELSTSKLQKNVAYDLLLIYGDDVALIPELTIQEGFISTSDADLQAFFDETEEGKIVIEDILIPEDYCDELIGG